MSKVEVRSYEMACDSCGNRIVSSNENDYGNSRERMYSGYAGLGGPRRLIMSYRVDFEGEKGYDIDERSETNVCAACIVRMAQQLIRELETGSISG